MGSFASHLPLECLTPQKNRCQKGEPSLLKSQIRTPALLLDMHVMEGNLKRMAAFFGEGPTRLRPHYKNHKCVALARRQLACGAIGITCATLGEAEALVQGGIQGILLANELAGAVKIERFAQLSRETDLIVAVDNERTIAALAAASARTKVQLSIVVDVDTGMGRCGVPPGEPALALAQLACAQGLRFRGLIGYEGHCIRMPPEPAKANAAQQAMDKLVSTANLIRSRGFSVEIVSAGGTGTYSISGRFPGVTEIQAGSYLLMDTDYQTVCGDFNLALSVLGTVISRAGNERMVLDIGLKEISGERGLPVLKNMDGARLRKLNAEHAIVDILDPNLPVQVGDQLELWAHYSDATVNLHRQMFGIRDGQVDETFLFES
jgi:D-serine deaminase-like pyridoxal phosphate-dependent protein